MHNVKQNYLCLRYSVVFLLRSPYVSRKASGYLWTVFAIGPLISNVRPRDNTQLPPACQDTERVTINQSINLYRAIVHRRVLQRRYAESKRNVLRRILNVLTDGAVRQFSGREFQSLGAATEKRRAAVSKLCGGTDRSFCVDDRSKRDWLYGLIKSAR